VGPLTIELALTLLGKRIARKRGLILITCR
jgi:hypothetical protein